VTARRSAFVAALLLLAALVVGTSMAQAGLSTPKGVSPAANQSVPFGDALVFAMTPEPGHKCSEYFLALDQHADDPHVGPRFEHPSCSVVVALGSELQADAGHTWRVWRNCSGPSCNGPGAGWHRSAKRSFHLDGPAVRTNPRDGATVSDLAFPIELSMSALAASTSFTIRMSSSASLDAIGKLSDPQITVPASRSASNPTSHLALITGLEPGLYYWQWVRMGSACGSSGTDCPGPVLRVLVDPTGTLPSLDVFAPRVKPLSAKGRVGKGLKLRYSVLEDQGQGQVTVWIYKGTKVKKRWRIWLGRVEPRKVFHVVWKPRKIGRYRLCTRARDGAKNTSKRRCARVTISARKLATR
jgi:hypothetical protein